MSAPVLITRQKLANVATAKWRGVYADGLYGANKIEILHKLEALGSTPDPDAVDAAIGNDSWTAIPQCDSCSAHAPVVVRVGQAPDYESNTAHLCWDCATNAAAAFTNGGAA